MPPTEAGAEEGHPILQLWKSWGRGLNAQGGIPEYSTARKGFLLGCGILVCFLLKWVWLCIISVWVTEIALLSWSLQILLPPPVDTPSRWLSSSGRCETLAACQPLAWLQGKVLATW